MTTVREHANPAGTSRFEAPVLDHLTRARQRIRLLDVTAAALGWIIFTLLYTMFMVVLDKRLELTLLARQLALAGYGVLALAYVALTIVRPLCRRINPYYAAREVERVVPDAKNSIVNWLDLQEQTLPATVRTALAQRAARDLSRADLEEAISGRRTLWLGGLTGALFFGLFVLITTFGFPQFGSLLNRTFAPFQIGPIPKRTHLTLIRPGDADVTVGKPVNIAVYVDGWTPAPEEAAALKLHYRYAANDPYEEQLLEPENGNVWSTVFPAAQVHNGFYYKVTGGDDATPEYHVTLRAAPYLTGFDVTYHFRPYLHWPDAVNQVADLQQLRGTEVTVVAHTSRAVKAGHATLEYPDGKQDLPAERVREDPQALRFKLVLKQDGTYRVGFTTTDNENNTESKSNTIKVELDQPPTVNLTKPASDKTDITLPANGTLSLEGNASDDHGLTKMALRLKVGNDQPLEKVYREGKSFRFPDGSYPMNLDYSEVVALDRLRDEHHQPLRLAKGTVLDCWVEAFDNYDYPAPNRGESRHFKVTLTDPLPPKQQAQERAQAEKKQKEDEAKQDKQLEKENREKTTGQKPDEPTKPSEGKDSTKPDSPPQDDPKGGGKDGPQKPGEAKGESSQETPSDKGTDPGQAKPDTPSDAKPDKGDAKNESSQGDPKGSQAGAKDAGDMSQKPETGDSKGPPQASQNPGEDKDQGNGQQDAAGPKPEGQPAAGQPDKSADKPAGPQGDPGQPKSQGADNGQKTETGDSKGSPQAGQNPGDKRDQGNGQQDAAGPKPENQPAAGQPEKSAGKPAGPQGDPGQAKSQGADNGQKTETGDSKGSPQAGQNPGDKRDQGNGQQDAAGPKPEGQPAAGQPEKRPRINRRVRRAIPPRRRARAPTTARRPIPVTPRMGPGVAGPGQGRRQGKESGAADRFGKSERSPGRAETQQGSE